MDQGNYYTGDLGDSLEHFQFVLHDRSRDLKHEEAGRDGGKAVHREVVSPYLGMELEASALGHAGVTISLSVSVSSLTRTPTLLTSPVSSR